MDLVTNVSTGLIYLDEIIDDETLELKEKQFTLASSIDTGSYTLRLEVSMLLA